MDFLQFIIQLFEYMGYPFQNYIYRARIIQISRIIGTQSFTAYTNTLSAL